MSGLFGVPVDAAYHVVTLLASILTPLPGGLAAAAAIVGITMAVRLLLLPLSYRATRGMAAQARVAPQVQALQKRYAGQPDRLRREVAALHAAEGTSMFAGCLPLLLQWPVFSVLSLLFRSRQVGGAPNTLLTHRLFGAPLASYWLGGAGPASAQGAVFAGLFVLLAVIAWLSARITARATAQAGTGAPGTGALPPGLTRVLPYATVAVAAFVPLAAALYLVTSTAWTLAERTVLQRLVARDRRPTSSGGRSGTGRPAIDRPGGADYPLPAGDPSSYGRVTRHRRVSRSHQPTE